jgi:phenylacetate 2-hydroxylase
MSLPRKTISEVDWDGAKIPAKTMVLINAQAANHGLYINPLPRNINADPC